MNRTFLRRLAVQVLVVVVALAAVLTSGAPAQSLGDVAKQEQARKKDSNVKVYTNENLIPAPAPAATSAAPPASTPAADGSKPAPTPDGKAADGAKPDAKAGGAADAKDAAAWKKRRQDLQEALDRSKLFADALQSRINGLTADFSGRDDPAQRSLVANDRQKALTELERAKKEVEQHTKELAGLEEEARKAGVPPGWVR